MTPTNKHSFDRYISERWPKDWWLKLDTKSQHEFYVFILRGHYGRAIKIVEKCLKTHTGCHVESLSHELQKLTHDQIDAIKNAKIEFKTTLEDSFHKADNTNKTNNMNTSYIQSIADDSIKTVKGVFHNQGRPYTYKTRDDVEVGDQHLVKAQNELKIIEIVAVDETPDIDQDSNIAYKWLGQKVNTAFLDEREEEDKEFAKSMKALARKKHRKEVEAMLGHELPKSIDTDANTTSKNDRADDEREPSLDV